MRGDLLQPTGPFLFFDVASRLPRKCKAFWENTPSNLQSFVSVCEWTHVRYLHLCVSSATLSMMSKLFPLMQEGAVGWLQIFKESGGVAAREQTNGITQVIFLFISPLWAALCDVEASQTEIPSHCWYQCAASWHVQWTIIFVVSIFDWLPTGCVAFTPALMDSSEHRWSKAFMDIPRLFKFLNLSCFFVKWIKLLRGPAPLICSLLWRSRRMTS